MNLFETAKRHFASQLPFVLFCKPNSHKIVGVFQQNDQLFELKDATESGFAFVSFDGKQRFYLPVSESNVVVDKNNQTDFHLSKEVTASFDENTKNSFENLVANGIQAIQNHQFQKVVLSRKELISVPNFDIVSVFKQLVFNYKTAFNYCFYHPKIGLWIGATPEQFIKIEATTLKTVALAGTQLFDNHLIWENKERVEQQLVTDFITQNLQLFSNEVAVWEPKTVQAGNLAHLKTDISAVIDKENLGQIIDKLHPTPAVCGMPKEPAKQFIVKNEGYDREFYTGFLGELNIDFTSYKTENSDLFVNLRCMKVEEEQASVFVGCGITKDSIPEKEFFETVNKSVTIKKSIV
ncbi:MAG: isochorismate synthase [Flavobacteriales bacterium]|nr:isochorismate synthase [Flavobacteriales bacterium]